jgi:hypothetical protein
LKSDAFHQKPLQINRFKDYLLYLTAELHGACLMKKPGYSEENLSPFVQKLNDHKQSLFTLLSIIALGIGVYLLFYPTTTSSMQATLGEIKVQKEALSAPDRTKESVSLATDSLKKILRTNKNLAPLFEGALLQALVEQGEIDEALKLSQPMFQRTEKDHLIHFETFAKNTLTIASNQLQLAQSTTQAQVDYFQKMEGSLTKEQDQLFAWAFIRLALLEQMTNENESARTHWKLLRQDRSSSTLKLPSKEAVDAVFKTLSIGSISFSDYVDSLSK